MQVELNKRELLRLGLVKSPEEIQAEMHTELVKVVNRSIARWVATDSLTFLTHCERGLRCVREGYV